MISLLCAMSQRLCVAIATCPFRYVLLPLLFCCAFVFGSLSIDSLSVSQASSSDAWVEFRQEMIQQMDRVLMDQMIDYQVDIDPYGTESYGVAVATGAAVADGKQLLVVGVYDKQSGIIETSKFPLTDLDLSRNW